MKETIEGQKHKERDRVYIARRETDIRDKKKK